MSIQEEILLILTRPRLEKSEEVSHGGHGGHGGGLSPTSRINGIIGVRCRKPATDRLLAEFPDTDLMPLPTPSPANP